MREIKRVRKTLDDILVVNIFFLQDIRQLCLRYGFKECLKGGSIFYSTRKA